MTTAGSAPSTPSPLEAHPELRCIMETSETFRRIAERARVVIDGRAHYLVYGDTLGTIEELFLDTLCRGSSSEGSDEASRALFLSLPRHLQDVIRSHARPGSPS